MYLVDYVVNFTALNRLLKFLLVCQNNSLDTLHHKGHFCHIFLTQQNRNYKKKKHHHNKNRSSVKLGNTWFDLLSHTVTEDATTFSSSKKNQQKDKYFAYISALTKRCPPERITFEFIQKLGPQPSLEHPHPRQLVPQHRLWYLGTNRPMS